MTCYTEYDNEASSSKKRWTKLQEFRLKMWIFAQSVTTVDRRQLQR